jgi:hypothetical protein
MGNKSKKIADIRDDYRYIPTALQDGISGVEM